MVLGPVGSMAFTMEAVARDPTRFYGDDHLELIIYSQPHDARCLVPVGRPWEDDHESQQKV